MTRALFPLALLFVGLAGCGQPKIVGTWKLDNPSGEAIEGMNSTEVTATFNADKSLVLKMTSTGTVPESDGKFDFTVVMDGTYTYEETVLDLTLTDVKLETSGLPEQYEKVMTGSLEKQKSALLHESNEKNQFKDVKWDGNDKMIVKNPEGKDVTFIRVK